MSDEMSVRQWQEKFRAGAFDRSDITTQCEAGWYDWFCQDYALAGRLKKIGKVVMGITDPFILDNYYVWFKNNCPLDGPLYDDARFDPLSGERGGKYFVVSLDSPHERMKWALVTERYGFNAPEFDCRDIREMVKYINSIGPELQQGFIPPFIAEKDAVTTYARRRGEPESLHIYRDGEHHYSYTSWRDRRKRTVLAVASLEDAPADFVSEQAHSIKGMYVYCPEDAGIPLADPMLQTANKSQKRREPER